MKLMEIKMQLRHLGLDTTGDWETLEKRLEEALRKSSCGQVFKTVVKVEPMEPVEYMDTSEGIE